MLEFNKLERKIAERLGNFAVTPCVGVWIEIEKNVRKHCGRNCRRKNYVKTDGTPLWMRKPGQGTNGI